MSIVVQKTASIVGLREPETKGAIVKGTRPSDTSLDSISAWCPSIFEGITVQSPSGSCHAWGWEVEPAQGRSLSILGLAQKTAIQLNIPPPLIFSKRVSTILPMV
jgi:hypothetical protein